MAEKLQYCLSGKPVALVTGGFHTASIAHVLKENQIPFVVVTPTVERLDQEQLYVRSLTRSEEHTSELQSPDHLVCRLLLEKKKFISTKISICTNSLLVPQ